MKKLLILIIFCLKIEIILSQVLIFNNHTLELTKANENKIKFILTPNKILFDSINNKNKIIHKNFTTLKTKIFLIDSLNFHIIKNFLFDNALMEEKKESDMNWVIESYFTSSIEFSNMNEKNYYLKEIVLRRFNGNEEYNSNGKIENSHFYEQIILLMQKLKISSGIVDILKNNYLIVQKK